MCCQAVRLASKTKVIPQFRVVECETMVSIVETDALDRRYIESM